VSRLRVFAILVVVTVLPACSQHKKTVDLGLKRITLDLAFKNPAKAAKPPTITQIIEAQASGGTATQLLGDIARPIASVANVPGVGCGTAPAGALPEIPVAGLVGKPPATGVYIQHNKGTYSLDGPLKLQGDFPPFSVMEIANATDDTSADAAGGGVRTITYDVILRSLITTTKTTYRSITRDSARAVGATSVSPVANELELVSVETKTGTGIQRFTPTPPVSLMQYGGEGAFWQSAGIDQETGTVMVVQGSIVKREPVDVCGKMIDTYRVESTEQVTNVLSGFSSQTKSGDPNVYNVATQFGGLVVRQHTDTTSTFVANGATSTLVIDNTSTVDSVTPKATP
jgi:hypothetical protein